MERNLTYDELKDFVDKSGIIFDDEQDERRFLDIVMGELELRIGRSISVYCNQKDLDEFEALSDISEKKEWLEKHVPQYKMFVRRHNIKIKSEIREYTDYINAQKEKLRKPSD